MPLPTTNDFTGRIWRLVTPGLSPLANIKVKGGTWTGGTPADIFSFVDIAGREYDWVYPADGSIVTFMEMGWLSGPITITALPHGEVTWFLTAGK